MKLLLLGANGQVGFELQRSLAPLGALVCATRGGRLVGGAPCNVVDFSRPGSVVPLLDHVAPDAIINAAAYTAVDRAEDEPEVALSVNGEAVGILGQWAASRGALMVHYSTDYVFDGAGMRPYREDDAVAPLGSYGRSKLAGEVALAASGADFLNFRTAWVYSVRGHNFLRTMLRLARERDCLTVVSDQRGAPTSARLIASATAAALARWFSWDAARRYAALGTHHLVAAGECSWHDFAVAIVAAAAEARLIERAPEVVPITTADFPTKAKRPIWSVLDTGRFQSTFGLDLPSWQAGLRDVIGELVAA